jgi:hypothetical protein
VKTFVSVKKLTATYEDAACCEDCNSDAKETLDAALDEIELSGYKHAVKLVYVKTVGDTLYYDLYIV